MITMRFLIECTAPGPGSGQITRYPVPARQALDVPACASNSCRPRPARVAYAGNKIEGKMNKIRTWSVSVRFDNGTERVISFDHNPGMVAGDPVKAAGSSIVRR